MLSSPEDSPLLISFKGIPTQNRHCPFAVRMFHQDAVLSYKDVKTRTAFIWGTQGRSTNVYTILIQALSRRRYVYVWLCESRRQSLSLMLSAKLQSDIPVFNQRIDVACHRYATSLLLYPEGNKLHI
ncbi:hypothetical protein Hypma_016501 [Hypsizygus marmoreus]|uniref:Uncharacterized protein n=1 Tax=Hypsizygus marmoreus TaxID=39966 RepID=A0A369IYR4_HYPMA|nr:hypothetical protein Hypma_016501 [Hypsizygus marmoreus]